MLKSVATDWKSTPPACTAFAEKARWNSQMTTVWIKEKQQPLKLTGPWLRKSSVHCDLFQHQLKSCGIEPLKMPMNIEKHQELKERQLYLNYYLEITTSSTVSVQIFMTLWSLCRGDGNNHGTHLPQSIQHMTTRNLIAIWDFCIMFHLGTSHTNIQNAMQTTLISDQTLAYTAKKVLMCKQTIQFQLKWSG